MLGPFRIRNLRSPSRTSLPNVQRHSSAEAIVELTGREYETNTTNCPASRLRYVDDEDAELVTVGTSAELADRLAEAVPKFIRRRSASRGSIRLEAVSRPGSPALHMFEIQRTDDSVKIWEDIAKATEQAKSHAPVETTQEEQVVGSSIEVVEDLSQPTIQPPLSFEEVNAELRCHLVRLSKPPQVEKSEEKPRDSAAHVLESSKTVRMMPEAANGNPSTLPSDENHIPPGELSACLLRREVFMNSIPNYHSFSLAQKATQIEVQTLRNWPHEVQEDFRDVGFRVDSLRTTESTEDENSLQFSQIMEKVKCFTQNKHEMSINQYPGSPLQDALKESRQFANQEVQIKTIILELAGAKDFTAAQTAKLYLRFKEHQRQQLQLDFERELHRRLQRPIENPQSFPSPYRKQIQEIIELADQVVFNDHRGLLALEMYGAIGTFPPPSGPLNSESQISAKMYVTAKCKVVCLARKLVENDPEEAEKLRIFEENEHPKRTKSDVTTGMPSHHRPGQGQFNQHPADQKLVTQQVQLQQRMQARMAQQMQAQQMQAQQMQAQQMQAQQMQAQQMQAQQMQAQQIQAQIQAQAQMQAQQMQAKLVGDINAESQEKLGASIPQSESQTQSYITQASLLPDNSNLTSEGKRQAEEAGSVLRQRAIGLLKYPQRPAVATTQDLDRWASYAGSTSWAPKPQDGPNTEQHGLVRDITLVPNSLSVRTDSPGSDNTVPPDYLLAEPVLAKTVEAAKTKPDPEPQGPLIDMVRTEIAKIAGPAAKELEQAAAPLEAESCGGDTSQAISHNDFDRAKGGDLLGKSIYALLTSINKDIQDIYSTLQHRTIPTEGASELDATTVKMLEELADITKRSTRQSIDTLREVRVLSNSARQSKNSLHGIQLPPTDIHALDILAVESLANCLLDVANGLKALSAKVVEVGGQVAEKPRTSGSPVMSSLPVIDVAILYLPEDGDYEKVRDLVASANSENGRSSMEGILSIRITPEEKTTMRTARIQVSGYKKAIKICYRLNGTTMGDNHLAVSVQSAMKIPVESSGETPPSKVTASKGKAVTSQEDVESESTSFIHAEPIPLPNNSVQTIDAEDGSSAEADFKVRAPLQSVPLRDPKINQAFTEKNSGTVDDWKREAVRWNSDHLTKIGDKKEESSQLVDDSRRNSMLSALENQNLPRDDDSRNFFANFSNPSHYSQASTGESALLSATKTFKPLKVPTQNMQGAPISSNVFGGDDTVLSQPTLVAPTSNKPENLEQGQLPVIRPVSGHLSVDNKAVEDQLSTTPKSEATQKLRRWRSMVSNVRDDRKPESSNLDNVNRVLPRLEALDNPYHKTMYNDAQQEITKSISTSHDMSHLASLDKPRLSLRHPHSTSALRVQQRSNRHSVPARARVSFDPAIPMTNSELLDKQEAVDYLTGSVETDGYAPATRFPTLEQFEEGKTTVNIKAPSFPPLPASFEPLTPTPQRPPKVKGERVEATKSLTGGFNNFEPPAMMQREPPKPMSPVENVSANFAGHRVSGTYDDFMSHFDKTPTRQYESSGDFFHRMTSALPHKASNQQINATKGPFTEPSAAFQSSAYEPSSSLGPRLVKPFDPFDVSFGPRPLPTDGKIIRRSYTTAGDAFTRKETSATPRPHSLYMPGSFPEDIPITSFGRQISSQPAPHPRPSNVFALGLMHNPQQAPSAPRVRPVTLYEPTTNPMDIDPAPVNMQTQQQHQHVLHNRAGRSLHRARSTPFPSMYNSARAPHHQRGEHHLRHRHHHQHRRGGDDPSTHRHHFSDDLYGSDAPVHHDPSTISAVQDCVEKLKELGYEKLFDDVDVGEANTSAANGGGSDGNDVRGENENGNGNGNGNGMKVGAKRLVVYAQAAEGSVWDAVEMIEEERKALKGMRTLQQESFRVTAVNQNAFADLSRVMGRTDGGSGSGRSVSVREMEEGRERRRKAEQRREGWGS